MYERTVEAATAETVSKFHLAEALVRDIPLATSIMQVGDRLIDARDAINAAGGEPRSLDVLGQYRKVGIWALEDGEFHWQKGASYTAHRRAMDAGLTWREFEALPHKTGDAALGAAGRGPVRRPQRVEDWSTAEREQVARELMSDPDARQAALLAINEQHERESLTRPRLPQPEDKGNALDDSMDMLGLFGGIHADLLTIATTLQGSDSLKRSAEFRDTVKAHVKDTRAALDLIEGIVDGSSTDDLWAAFERSGGAA